MIGLAIIIINITVKITYLHKIIVIKVMLDFTKNIDQSL